MTSDTSLSSRADVSSDASSTLRRFNGGLSDLAACNTQLKTLFFKQKPNPVGFWVKPGFLKARFCPHQVNIQNFARFKVSKI